MAGWHSILTPQPAEILRPHEMMMFRRATVKAEGWVRWTLKRQGDVLALWMKGKVAMKGSNGEGNADMEDTWEV